jgi:hypothetical protein
MADSLDLHFPAAGLDASNAFCDQRPRVVSPDGSIYARTAREGVNVRTFDSQAHRARGGSRPGLAKYLAAPVVRNWLTQELATIVTKGDAVQLSNSGRVVTLVAVSQGNVYRVRAGDTAWTTPTNNTGDTPPLIFDGLVRSAPNVQRLWFADGINWVFYDPVTDTVEEWTASAGTLPQDSGQQYAAADRNLARADRARGLVARPLRMVHDEDQRPAEHGHQPDAVFADSGDRGDQLAAGAKWATSLQASALTTTIA